MTEQKLEIMLKYKEELSKRQSETALEKEVWANAVQQQLVDGAQKAESDLNEEPTQEDEPKELEKAP